VLSNKKIKLILKRYKEDFEELELYDKTREWPIGRERIDITLDKKIIKKLKMLKERTGNSVSRIIEEAVEEIK